MRGLLVSIGLCFACLLAVLAGMLQSEINSNVARFNSTTMPMFGRHIPPEPGPAWTSLKFGMEKDKVEKLLGKKESTEGFITTYPDGGSTLIHDSRLLMWNTPKEEKQEDEKSKKGTPKLD